MSNDNIPHNLTSTISILHHDLLEKGFQGNPRRTLEAMEKTLISLHIGQSALMASYQVLKIDTDEYFLGEPKTEAPKSEVINSSNLSSLRTIVYGKSQNSNLKKLQIKPTTRGYAIATIRSEVYEKLWSGEYDKAATTSNIIDAIIFNPEYIYVTKNNKLVFNLDDELFSTEVYKNQFIAADDRTEEMLQNDYILSLITGDFQDKTLLSIESILDFVVRFDGNTATVIESPQTFTDADIAAALFSSK